MVQSLETHPTQWNLTHYHSPFMVMLKPLLMMILQGGILLNGVFETQAQVNVEQSRGQAHEGFNLSLDGSLALIRGNVSLSQIGLGTKLNYAKGIHSPFIHAMINYGEKNEQAFLDQSYVHARWTAMWFKSWGTELFAQAQENSFRNLILRQLYGAGVRAELLDNTLALGGGAMYEREVYQEQSVSDVSGVNTLLSQVTENNIRLTHYFSAKKDLKWATLIQMLFTIYYQPRIDKFRDYRVLADLGINIKLSESLRVVESLSVMYDSEPPEGVQKTDLKSMSSLRLVF